MNQGRGVVLLVDDDPDFRAATSRILEDKGYLVLEAPNGARGLELARDRGPDVILIDVVMDTYSEGFDLIRRLAADGTTRRIPRVILSTLRLVQEMDTVFPEELGTTHILQKPIARGALLEAVAAAIATGRGGAESPGAGG